MRELLNQIERSALKMRAVPFLLVAGLTLLQGRLGPASVYWVYLLKMVLGAVLVVWMHRRVEEMRWKIGWEAVAAGVLVVMLWVGLDPFYPKLSARGGAWNPPAFFGEGSALAWFFLGVRIVGSSLIVPPLEEVFYRSLLYRYIAQHHFQGMRVGELRWMSFLVTSALFGLAHYEWLAGLLCGLLYQALVIRKDRLGDAMTAHAITNFLLGVWVVWQGAWQFW